ncbi:unnamed protein product [Candida verbasci]|uniref:Oligopeptide transporter 2 n=1 Tax=Candida verbasci TaxID=1227364 RepID=A0A9W4XHL8_9ASCO|nr:unnamed protein product [Candida verbasci]
MNINNEKHLAGQVSNIRSVSTHLSVQDHEVDLQAMYSNPLSIGEVGTTLTDTQKNIILHKLQFDHLTSYEKLPPQAQFIIEKVEQMPSEEAVEILKAAYIKHEHDVNMEGSDLELWKKLLDNSSETDFSFVPSKIHEKLAANIDVKQVNDDDSTSDEELGSVNGSEVKDWALQVRLEAVLVAYWSPYFIVRSVCDPYDDPTIPCETLRVYIISIIWVAIQSVINEFFSQRLPSISLSSAAVQVFLYPSGVLFEKILPKWKFKIWKYEFDLNPGPYNFKEQMLASCFTSVAGGTVYVTYNVLMQKMDIYYGNKWVDVGYQVLLMLSTQFMGFGFSGLLRKFAVYPTDAVWPSILPTIRLNKTLMTPERPSIINGWKISSYNFFFVSFAAAFAYLWLPSYLFAALSNFNWMTWIKPDNLDLTVITGYNYGLGFNPFPTFDWTVIGSGNLYQPFFTTLSSYIGSIISFFIIVGIYYSNYKWTKYIPINSNKLFTNEGQTYHVSQVVDENSMFDEKKYEQIGPPFYSAANLVQYGAFFAIYPFHFVYEIATNYKAYGVAFKSFYLQFKDFKRSTYEGSDDPHVTMMKAYPEVPEWIYLTVLVLSIVFAILCVKIYPAETPVWSIFFVVGLNFVFLIPLVSVSARTMFSLALNVLVELIIGYAIPGNGLALAFIKALGTQTDSQAFNWVNSLKIAQYSKVPPRALFRCQMLSTLISLFIQLGILNFQISSVKDFCLPTNEAKLYCASATTFYTASVQWGVIGPKKIFDGLYPIFACGFLIWAPTNLAYVTGGLYVGYAFMHYIRKRFRAWWAKYNYIFASAIGAGNAFSAIIIFFAVQYHPKDISWWGNTVSYGGYEGFPAAHLNATLQAPDGYFGPRKGHFP